MNSYITPNQYGFIPGKSILTPISIIAKAVETGLDVLLLDSTGAFDSIRLAKVVSELIRAIGREKAKEVLAGLYPGEVVEDGQNPMKVENGVLQGSPFLFILTTSPLVEELQNCHIDIANVLAFADDMALV